MGRRDRLYSGGGNVMKPLRAVLIDDERLARVVLRDLLSIHAGVEIVGEASGLKVALQLIEQEKPDLLFLDIQMPGGGGFELLNALAEPPHVIFVTAYDQYAIRAFDVNAVDYLLKPVKPERLAKSLERIRKSSRERTSKNKLSTDDVAMLNVGASGHFIAVADMLLIEADGNYSRLHAADGKSYMARQTLTEWMKRLPPE
ncbi:MAG: response regulator, partial [Spartobacteria bacterium]|nr:response regulator [Spartobacteria bacterium]